MTYEVVVTTPAGDVVARFEVTEDDFRTTMGTLAVGDRVRRGLEAHRTQEEAADASR